MAMRREHNGTRRLLKSCPAVPQRSHTCRISKRPSDAPLKKNPPRFSFSPCESPLIPFRVQSARSHSLIQTPPSARLVYARHHTPSVHTRAYDNRKHEVLRRFCGRNHCRPGLYDYRADAHGLYVAFAPASSKIGANIQRLPAQHDKLPRHGGSRWQRDFSVEQDRYSTG
jgi:hypothetical protein